MRLDRRQAPVNGDTVRLHVRRSFGEWLTLTIFGSIALAIGVPYVAFGTPDVWSILVVVGLQAFCAVLLFTVLRRRSGTCMIERDLERWRITTKRWFGRRSAEELGCREVVSTKIEHDRDRVPFRLRIDASEWHVLLTLRSGREVHVAEGFGRRDEELATLRRWFEEAAS